MKIQAENSAQTIKRKKLQMKIQTDIFNFNRKGNHQLLQKKIKQYKDEYH